MKKYNIKDFLDLKYFVHNSQYLRIKAKNNFCNNSVKHNARNVITAIGFLIANEYLIFCGSR
ncbi:hypothetical protein GLOIN_2v1700032 [Rhizophagus irregularis DAOM 181602=DAOM 197198]|uniref:Uncharacterized protein n=1 Tax=Rhizophagus irregularis (strain DAOM 181602 / DAOM 197198 / MUCL 43194) TaxID=747089 RepID=U9UBL4_RHIID|nr:hypothetical protein GLOIN_2v1700032 [Rhizophagus irregularis DAOM 181602=DAOM 197198]POG61991.1 hypothetical protein GLOIN_2v1700032 [Rhizophagus irregularis DAOM 181602=DAOM 197198]|eukprot:XP_025168857.1 hypothetical protein GLOIN_2v1700032 [Rhizophagus irregularis DAOM 181602=DAOM 197198]